MARRYDQDLEARRGPGMLVNRRNASELSNFSDHYIATRRLQATKDVKALIERTACDHCAADPVSRSELSEVLDARWGFTAIR